MRTATTVAPGQILIRDDVPEPQPGVDEVVVRVESVGICGSDVHAWKGDHPYFHYPGVQGHEFGGRVTAMGASAEGSFAVGDRVAVEPTRACGTCLPCRRGRSNCCDRLQVMGAHIAGAFAELVAVPVSSCHGVGDLDRTLTALVEPISIGSQAVARARIAAGDQVVVLGAGPIGLAIVLTSTDLGATVLAADRIQSRLDLASELGADKVVHVTAEDLAARVATWTGGDGPIVVVEATGVPAVVRQAVDLVASSGTVVIVGLSQEEVSLPLLEFTRKELTVVGSRNNVGRFPASVDLVRRKPALVERLVTHRFPLDRIADAMDLAARQPSDLGKILIEVDG